MQSSPAEKALIHIKHDSVSSVHQDGLLTKSPGDSKGMGSLNVYDGSSGQGGIPAELARGRCPFKLHKENHIFTLRN